MGLSTEGAEHSRWALVIVMPRFHYMVPARLDSTRLFWFSITKKYLVPTFLVSPPSRFQKSRAGTKTGTMVTSTDCRPLIGQRVLSLILATAGTKTNGPPLVCSRSVGIRSNGLYSHSCCDKGLIYSMLQSMSSDILSMIETIRCLVAGTIG